MAVVSSDQEMLKEVDPPSQAELSTQLTYNHDNDKGLPCGHDDDTLGTDVCSTWDSSSHDEFDESMSNSTLDDRCSPSKASPTSPLTIGSGSHDADGDFVDGHAFSSSLDESSHTHAVQHRHRVANSGIGHRSAATHKIPPPKHRVGGKAAVGRVISTLGLYSFCSVSMVVTNKSLSSSYTSVIKGDLNVLLVVFQAMISVAAVYLCKKMRLIDYPPFRITTAYKLIPCSSIFCVMLFTGMAALRYNSVPIVAVNRNVTNIVVTSADYFFFGAKPDKLVLVLVAVSTVLSGVIAAISSSSHNGVYVTWEGGFWMILNCLSTASYVVYMKLVASEHVKLPKFGMVFYNNVLCTFCLLPVAMTLGQVQCFIESPAIHTPDYFFKILFAGLAGFFINFASFHCGSTSETNVLGRKKICFRPETEGRTAPKHEKSDEDERSGAC